MNMMGKKISIMFKCKLLLEKHQELKTIENIVKLIHQCSYLSLEESEKLVDKLGYPPFKEDFLLRSEYNKQQFRIMGNILGLVVWSTY